MNKINKYLVSFSFIKRIRKEDSRNYATSSAGWEILREEGTVILTEKELEDFINNYSQKQDFKINVQKL